MKRTIQKGFTLIELMIVIAIIGILAAIAIPMYQDYTVRAKVTEGITAASPCKLGVAEFYASNSSYPGSLTSAGCTTVATTYVSSVGVGNGGVVTVTLTSITGLGGAAGGQIVLTPQTAVNGAVDWRCAGAGNLAGAGSRFVPTSCRGSKT
jgi:type IV pilus assembly protein PilA